MGRDLAGTGARARPAHYIVTTAAYYGEGELPVDEIISRDGWQHLKAVKKRRCL